MSSLSGLQGIINETKAAFVIAKFDGKLEAAEVVQIATDVAMKIHALSVGSADEKMALVALALKKGLAAADGLHGLTDLAGPAALAAAEKQVLDAALAAVNGLMKVAPHIFAPVKSLAASLRGSFQACLPFCSRIAEVLDPKDQALIAEALKVSEPVQPVVASTLESVIPVQPVLETLDESIDETEPSLEASPPEVLLPTVPGTTE